MELKTLLKPSRSWIYFGLFLLSAYEAVRALNGDDTRLHCAIGWMTACLLALRSFAESAMAAKKDS